MATMGRDRQPGPNVPRYYYVPDEICIVVSLDPDVQVDDADWNGQVYEPVRVHLNERITALLDPGQRNPLADGDGSNPDLAPTTARQRFGGSREVLRPLERERVNPRADAGETPPWVRLQRRDRRTIALHFYRIGLGRTGPSETTWNEASARTVRDLVNGINRSYQYERPRNVRGHIAAATPNWLFGAAQSGYIGGGPGTDPEPVPAGDLPGTAEPPFRFQFGNEALQQLVQGQRDADPVPNEKRAVVVAVLDTCPIPDDVRAAATRNWLLGEVAHEVKIDDPQFLPPDYFTFVEHIEPGRGEHHGDGTSHDIRDHGLFAAGIIRDIAPSARIHLVRVLDHTGVGDLLALASILCLLPGRLGLTDEHRLVINLSLMAAIPVSDEFPKHWFPSRAQNPQALLQIWSKACATLGTIRTSLGEVIAWLQEQGHLVVASAGNDAPHYPERPEPRYPARFDSVIGVAAVKPHLLPGPVRVPVPASYSNQGDFVVIGNGVAIFGGDDPIAERVVGVFSQPQFPFDKAGTKLNRTGWAYWAGTSFAAPVISAIAADLWTTDTGLTPAKLITKITRPIGMTGPATGGDPTVVGLYAVQPEPELDCSAIEAEQEPR
jgi:subtilisin family serine protease